MASLAPFVRRRNAIIVGATGGEQHPGPSVTNMLSTCQPSAPTLLSVPTRQRKVLRANAVAPWELRIGDLRVYYEVKDDGERVVVVKAVGVKERNRVLIGGEEVEL